ncbi:nuclear transport factor 2 family protein [Fodinicola acaciae]|uniref:nuclear transport factor 2 family protein n=1 Tax=Fodinicola acaciae TaxID=2681555 RepID=UPI0013D65B8D|nr:nuclear transport factor 2 family protein [Fodinicola acaciae]
MTDRDALLDTDRRFFAALTAGDSAALDSLLTDDFLLVAVSGGGVVDRTTLLTAVTTGALTFPAIKAFPEQAVVRRVGPVGIVVGRTAMTFDAGSTTAVQSRYTHVFRTGPDGWQLMSAQGTEITAS